MCILLFFFLMIRRPPRSTLDRSSAASDVYKRQYIERLIQQIYQEVGSEEGPSDSFQMINLRFEILSLAALGKNRSLLLGLSSEFRDNILSFGNINPEKRMLVLYAVAKEGRAEDYRSCLLYTSPSPRDRTRSRMPSSA